MLTKQPSIRHFEFDHAPRLVPLHDDVIEGAVFELAPVGERKPCRKQLAFVGLVASLQHGIDVSDHFIGQDVGQEAEPATVDAEQRHAARKRELRREEHGAVPANRHDEVRLLAEVRHGLADESVGQPVDLRFPVEKHGQPQRAQVRRQRCQGIGDSGVFDLADQGDAGEVLVHSGLQAF